MTVQSLYEAAGMGGRRVDGFHKMRYRIQKCDIEQAHAVFEASRKGNDVQQAVVVTKSPEAYPIAVM